MWSRAPGQFFSGQLIEQKVELRFFSFKFSKFLKFSDIFIFFNSPQIFGNEIFIPINLIILKAPPVQF